VKLICGIDGCQKRHNPRTHREHKILEKRDDCIRGCERKQSILKYGLCRQCYVKEQDFVKNHKYKAYGMTLADFIELEAKQNALCAICGLVNTLSRHGTFQHLCVDHDHETGKIRGLLCNACNLGLGHFKDNAINLRKAADYLEVKK
jgi:hypothetical protein